MESIVKTHYNNNNDIEQGSIYKNVEFIEYIIEKGDIIECSKIIFPHVIVLSQSCDLIQDYSNRKRKQDDVDNKGDQFLLSVIVAPIYNFNDFVLGNHLSELGLTMDAMGSPNRTKYKNLISNENKRYHYLQFEEKDKMTKGVIDFKHYFTVTSHYLEENYNDKYVFSLNELYREQVTQRFANFLSRIGLPDGSGI